MSALDLLTRTRAHVAKGWTQGANARDSRGSAVPHDRPQAVCWCLYGALMAADHFRVAMGEATADNEDLPFAHLALMRQIKVAIGGGVALSMNAWNDRVGRTQAEVLAVVDAAIEEEG